MVLENIVLKWCLLDYRWEADTNLLSAIKCVTAKQYGGLKLASNVLIFLKNEIEHMFEWDNLKNY